YSTPDPSSQFSFAYFTGLSFGEAAKLHYPNIYPPKTISAWTFTHEAAVSDLASNEAVPHLDDLNSILNGMEAAFNRGARSVGVTLTVSGRNYYHSYSFIKIRIFAHINNFSIAVDSAHALVDYMTTTSLLTPTLLDRFLSTPMTSKMFGIYVSDFPLWKLSCLLGEDWLHEDVVNALSELLYFTAVAESDAVDPPVVILPTSFLADAKYLYEQSPRLFSPNLVALRHRLRSAPVNVIYALNCFSDHYSTYRH
ncbi:hypothetical protein R3P38DRAFT_3476237, partial [Favolaschia claudopus]